MSVHVLLPFLPDMDNDPDFDSNDLHAAVREDWQRQRIIEAWLKGKASITDVMDCMSDHGMDAYEWEEAMADSVDRLIETPNVLIDDADLILDERRLRYAS